MIGDMRFFHSEFGSFFLFRDDHDDRQDGAKKACWWKYSPQSPRPYSLVLALVSFQKVIACYGQNGTRNEASSHVKCWIERETIMTWTHCEPATPVVLTHSA